jgi:biotin carboxylase
MQRLLLLLPTTTYRTKAFIDAALRLGVEITVASEYPSTLAETNPSGLLTLSLYEPEKAAREAADFAKRFPISAVIPVDEDTAIVAAYIAQALDLKQNSVDSASAAKNKHQMRELLSRAGVRVPRYWLFSLDEDLERASKLVTYPSVVKPVFLSTSRGVIRADNETEFISAVRRLEAILKKPEVAKRGRTAARQFLVEEFIPGFEVALEGMLLNGELKMLAIFDKPDPLDGPFFEETIYVTPSRLSDEIQKEVIETAAAAARAMGLTKGPIHAELRINEHGPWVIEVAARAIGGLCSRALRFGDGVSLEDLILEHALGRDVSSVEREDRAAGVMMIPVPRAGVLREVRGIDKAKSIPDVEDVIITAHITKEIFPPPEGSSYLGFIFSRTKTPDRVETALREAHNAIEFIIEPLSK